MLRRFMLTRPLRGFPRKPLVFERLEDRTVPSGETVTVDIGLLPAGKTERITFDVIVDNPAVKGIDAVYNQGKVTGGNIPTVLTDDPGVGGTTDPNATVVDRAPQVVGVFVRSSSWNSTFLTQLQSAGLGSATFGYAIPTGANQLASVPWFNVDRISIRFNENVSVAADDLQVLGATVASYGLDGTSFAYDATTFTATWALTATTKNDKLRLVLDSAAATGVVQAGTGGGRLDGEWTDGTSTGGSGDGVAGGDFPSA